MCLLVLLFKSKKIKNVCKYTILGILWPFCVGLNKKCICIFHLDNYEADNDYFHIRRVIFRSRTLKFFQDLIKDKKIIQINAFICIDMSELWPKPVYNSVGSILYARIEFEKNARYQWMPKDSRVRYFSRKKNSDTIWVHT